MFGRAEMSFGPNFAHKISFSLANSQLSLLSISSDKILAFYWCISNHPVKTRTR